MLAKAWQLPGLKHLRRSGRLNALLRTAYGPRWGKFQTRDDALTYLRPADRLTYDTDDVVLMNIDVFSTIHDFDWPVLFLMQQMISEGRLRTVTDFGGHVGVKYNAFRTVMTFPDDFVWQVVDVPAACREGRRRSPREDRLHFFEDLNDTVPCDLLLCSGVMQYVDFTIEEMVDRLPGKPPFIVLNKVSLADEAFFTLEAFGRGRMPYRILAPDDLVRAREALGYTLLFRWDIPQRGFHVHAVQGHVPVKVIGEAWGLRDHVEA